MEVSPSPASGAVQRIAKHKIQSIEELGRLAANLRTQGKTVVLAHGCFDLLHMGHVRHLEAARREGDILFVTVTADAFVNKGPGRPVFSENMRAEMLASLECVEAVGVVESGSAEPVLRAIKPDIYIKGSDYKNAEDDITGKIMAEAEVVQSHGGRIVFTEEITFSSSNLINRYMDIYDPSTRQYLDRVQENYPLDSLVGFIEKVQDLKVLFIGDTIIDEYQYVTPLGKSPKENMIATLYKEHEVFAGGVIAAANHAASFCSQVDIITSLGAGDPHEGVVREALRPNIQLRALYRPGAPTTRKCRFIDPGYSMRKLFEVYHMDDSPPCPDEEDQFLGLIEPRLDEYDLVVVTDFGHGLMGPRAIDMLCEKAPFLAVNTQSNSANHGFNLVTKYRRADYVCIDGPEAKLALGNKYADLEVIAGDLLPKRIDCPNIVITQGKNGCVAYQAGQRVCRVPALTSTIVDTVGAGDAFFAVTAPFVAAGAPAEVVGLLGNAAGAMKVGIVGHRSSVEKVPLVKFLTALMK